MRALLVIPALVLVLAGGASAQSPSVFGTVGPGFSIRFSDAAGNPVKHLDPGTYTIQIEDKADIHNFHLTGPGVDRATDTDQVGTVTWTVTLADGKYHYQCDPHASTMRGDFTVGTAPATPPATAKTPVSLSASVGPGASIALTRLGTQVKTLPAGPVVLTVNDRSAKDNYRFAGPGVNRTTSKSGKGTVTWKLTLKRGLYTYRSDATATLRGTLRVT